LRILESVVSYFRYEELVQKALINLVYEVLKDVSAHGLSGDHHFYIRFRTDHPKTKISSYLKQKHPEEIMIVIQYQFWNLTVAKDHFCVDLSFNSIRETLKIPFAAMTAFVDPSVKFALQFTPSFDDEDPLQKKDNSSAKHKESKSVETDGKVISLDSFRKK
jgi:hypothetical protein